MSSMYMQATFDDPEFLMSHNKALRYFKERVNAYHTRWLFLMQSMEL